MCNSANVRKNRFRALRTQILGQSLAQRLGLGLGRGRRALALGTHDFAAIRAGDKAAQPNKML